MPTQITYCSWSRDEVGHSEPASLQTDAQFQKLFLAQINRIKCILPMEGNMGSRAVHQHRGDLNLPGGSAVASERGWEEGVPQVPEVSGPETKWTCQPLPGVS